MFRARGVSRVVVGVTLLAGCGGLGAPSFRDAAPVEDAAVAPDTAPISPPPDAPVDAPSPQKDAAPADMNVAPDGPSPDHAVPLEDAAAPDAPAADASDDVSPDAGDGP